MNTVSVATPHHRAIVLVDIQGSTTRTNVAKARLRQWMYDLLKKAMRASKIAERHRDPLIDRGDGVMVLVHPVRQVPKTLLLNTFVPALTMLLAEHNARWPDHQFRLRVAVHAGEVHYDARGVFGEAIDLACRLLDAPEVKEKLTEIEGPVVLVVSDDIYHSLIRHGYDGIDQHEYEQLCQVRVGMRPHQGWTHVPATVPGQRYVVSRASS